MSKKRAGKRKIRLAIIGCGGFVRYHVRGIMQDVGEFQAVGLADVDRARAEALGTEFFAKDAPRAYTDHAEMLKQTRPEAVIVSSPHTLHYRHACDALAAGAHVMVDKPMVTDSSDARKLVAKAKAARRHLAVAIQGMYTDTFAYARKLIADGKFGQMQLVTCILAQGWMEGTRGKWRQDPKLSGGGQLYDSNAHVLSAMMFLLDSPVKEVMAWADYKGCKVDINSVGIVKFANGAMATITCGGNCPAWKSHLVLQSDRALMEISPHGGNFSIQSGADKKLNGITGVPKGWKVPTVSPVRNFADVILGKAKAPRVDGRMGILMSDLMDAIYASIRTGKTAKVTRKPPKR